MVRLVHLAPEPLRRRIERAGVRGRRHRFDVAGVERDEHEAIFTMPVLEDFAATYQWVRELRRSHRGRLIAVHLRIPDDEDVLVGRFGPRKRRTRAADAVSAIRESPWGQEIVVCRRVPKHEVSGIRDIRQDIGWAETPDSSHKYDCVCLQCLPRGTPDLLRRCRAAFNIGMQRAHSRPDDVDSLLTALRSLDLPLERAGKRLEPKKLMPLAGHEAAEVRRCVVWLLGYFRRDLVLAPVLEMLTDSEHSVRTTALESLLRLAGPREAWHHVRQQEPALAEDLIDILEFWPGRGARDVLRELARLDVDGALSRLAVACLQRAMAD